MKTVAELRQAYVAGTLSPVTVVQEAFALIKAQNPDINAFLHVYEVEALEQAREAEQQYKESGEAAPPLLGIPVAIKNNILIKGKKVTAGSRMLENYTATYDATIIRKLKEAGAVIMGATNMDEFASGSSTENSAFGPTKNPLDVTRVPGGTSGGSAAAVAMKAVPVAIGTDTGGSIRQPASYCGLVGFKPTYGAVSRYGLVAQGSSLDQAGPLATTVADAELVYNIMAGEDKMDATTISADTYQMLPEKKTYSFGIPKGFVSGGVDKDVVERFESHIAELKQFGYEVVEVELPLYEQGLAAYYIVMFAEMSSNLARYDGIRYGLSAKGEDLLAVYENSRAEGFGAEIKRRILLGTYVLSSGYYDAYYGKAELVRRKMREELAAVFKTVDFILTPTAPTPAFKLGEKSDPLSMYRQDIFTVPVNLVGVPALTFPMGTVERDGVSLPVGVQYIAPHGGDARLFEVGKKMYDERR